MALWSILAAVVLVGVVQAWARSGPVRTHDLGDVAVLAGACALAGLLVVARGVLVRRERAAWLLVALSLFLMLGKDLAWHVLTPSGAAWLGPPVHDVIHLVLLAPGIIAVVLLLRSRFELTAGPIVDMIVGALVLPMIFVALLVGGVIGDAGTAQVEEISWAADPVVKLIMACALVAVLARSGSRPDRTFSLLLAGVGVTCVADLLSPEHGLWHDVGPGVAMLSLTGMVLIALSAWQEPPRARHKPALGRGALVVPVAFALLALTYLVAGGSLDSSPAVTAVIGVGLLISAFHAGLVASELYRRRAHRMPAGGGDGMAPDASGAPLPALVRSQEVGLAPDTVLLDAPMAHLSSLTPREGEVAGLVAEGLLQKQVARELGVSPKTVEKHLASSRRKLGVATTNELIVLVHSPAGRRSVRSQHAERGIPSPVGASPP